MWATGHRRLFSPTDTVSLICVMLVWRYRRLASDRPELCHEPYIVSDKVSADISLDSLSHEFGQAPVKFCSISSCPIHSDHHNTQQRCLLVEEMVDTKTHNAGASSLALLLHDALKEALDLPLGCPHMELTNAGTRNII